MTRAVIALTILVALSQQPGATGGDWPRVAALHARRVQEVGIVGSSLWFVADGQVAHKAVVGYQDLATKRAVDDETIYHWASVTKTLTGIAVMQLRDRGRQDEARLRVRRGQHQPAEAIAALVGGVGADVGGFGEQAARMREHLDAGGSDAFEAAALAREQQEA